MDIKFGQRWNSEFGTSFHTPFQLKMNGEIYSGEVMTSYDSSYTDEENANSIVWYEDQSPMQKISNVDSPMFGLHGGINMHQIEDEIETAYMNNQLKTESLKQLIDNRVSKILNESK